jgi:hypothetical protein
MASVTVVLATSVRLPVWSFAIYAALAGLRFGAGSMSNKSGRIAFKYISLALGIPLVFHSLTEGIWTSHKRATSAVPPSFLMISASFMA